MSEHERSRFETLFDLNGSWEGWNRLWLSTDEPAQESSAGAEVSPTAKGNFLTLEYTWAYDGKPQEGLLLLGYGGQDQAAQAVWVDSWHMGKVMMRCEGEFKPDGSASVTGSYAAPPGPDWGWRIVIEPGDGTFRLVMYNIHPDNVEDFAVEASFTKI